MRSNFLTGAMLALCGTTALSPALAQDTPAPAAPSAAATADNGDIIVTATRREQTLQKVPLAVTAFSADTLVKRNISSLGDIQNGTIPGMQLVPFAGSSTLLAVTARGVGTSDTTQGTQELPVPIYIDGVPMGRAQGSGLDLIEPERIEFLRGPQGQLFGRNAEGGAIQYVARRPSGKFGFDVSGQVGNYAMNRERVRVDLPEFANIKIQFSAVHNQHDPFTVNKPKGVYSKQASYGFLDSTGYRAAVEWSPSTEFRANYSYDNSKIKDGQPYGVWVPVDIIGRPPFSPMPPGDNHYPSRVNEPAFNEPFHSYARGHSLTLQYQPSTAITLKSITSYRESGRHGSSTLSDALIAGGSSTGVLLANAREDIDAKQWYQELQGVGTWEHFNVTAGLTYFNEKVQDGRLSRLTGSGFNPPALGLSPATLAGCIGLELCTTSVSQQHAKTNSYGAYIQGTYTPPILDDKLELTAGVRYSNDKKVAIRTYIQPLALPPILPSAPSGALPPPAVFKAKRWDPAFVVKYNFNNDVNVYARYASGYRAGGANVRSSTFTSYGAEVNKAIEVGLKSRWFDRRLTLNVAYFHNHIVGQQLAIQEAPSTNPSLTNTLNVKKPVNVSGVEIEANLHVAKGLSLSANYSYTHAKKWVEFDNPITVAVDPTRFYSIQTPKHAGSVAADYESPSFGFGKLVFHADYEFSSKYWTTPGGLLIASLGPTYSRPTTRTNSLNGRVAIDDIGLGGAKAQVAVFAKNLLQDTHYVYGFDGAASGGGFMEVLTPPRTFGVELRIRY